MPLLFFGVAVVLVGLFFLKGRAQQIVNLALDQEALIIGDVDGAGEADEFIAEVLIAFAEADVIFNDPEGFVDVFELGLKGAQALVFIRRQMRGYYVFQRLQFSANVGEFGFIMDALVLDGEDGDFINQFAPRNGSEDILH